MKTEAGYDKKALEFCESTGLIIEKRYTGHRPYFTDEKEYRAVWSITLKREGNKPYTFTYGASIMDSWKFVDPRGDTKWWKSYTLKIWRDAVISGENRHEGAMAVLMQKTVPTDHEILAALISRVYTTFAEFAGEFGYDPDSHSARKIWEAVNEQAAALQAMFTDSELERLAEIQ